MLHLPMVILKHVSRTGSHYDWLLANPRDPAGPLWTARMNCTSAHWRQQERWMLEPLPAHRRSYLHHQGPIGPGPKGETRGSVVRLDSGSFTPLLWTATRMILDVKLAAFDGRVQLQRCSPSRWTAFALPPHHETPLCDL